MAGMTELDTVHQVQSAPTQHWNSHARRWAKLGRPLRPGPEDIERYEAEVSQVASTGRPLKALLLGVTPEIACMNWPTGSLLVATDHAIGMVEGVWPQDKLHVPALAVVGEWRRLPLADASVDFAVGDGSYNSLESAASQAGLSRELFRVLKPGGRLVLRVYVRPDPPEPLPVVFDDLLAGRIGSFDAFKLRLLMAVPPNTDGAVPLERVWHAWADVALDRIQLSTQTGWSVASIDTIDAYYGNAASYMFMSLAEFRRMIAVNFVEIAAYEKTYELGAFCPTLILQPRRDPFFDPA
jgi:SAM-dependent methyltransferase